MTSQQRGSQPQPQKKKSPPLPRGVRFLLIFTTLSLVSVILVACGVHVEVATPFQPSPTPRRFVGGYYDGSDTVSRQQAAPRIVFTDDKSVQTELFITPNQAEAVVMQYKNIRVWVDYDVTWFASPQSNVRIRINVYKRTSADQAWQPYGNDEREVSNSSAPSNAHDALGVNLYAEEHGSFQIRAEVGIVAYPAKGEIVNKVSTTEFNVRVLSDPGEVKLDPEAVKSGYGDITSDKFLMDWRGWRGGPCGTRDHRPDGDPTKDALSQACDAFNSNNLVDAAKTLLGVMNQTSDTDLQLSIAQQLSMITFVAGDLENAEKAFDAVIRFSLERDRAVDLVIALHNLAAVQADRNELDAAAATIARLTEIRTQFSDEFGRALTQANIGKFFKERWRVEESYYYFNNNGLPQAKIAEIWDEELKAQ